MNRSLFTRTRLVKAVLFSAACFFAAASGLAQSNATADKLNAELKQSLTELAKTQEQIARERIALAKQLSESEQSVLAKKAALAQLRKSVADAASDNREIKTDIDKEKENRNYAESALRIFAQEMEKRLPLNLVNSWEKAIQAAQMNLTDGLQFTDLVVKQIGQQVTDGTASDAKGNLIPGHFVQIGPMHYFLSNDKSRAGIVHEEINAAYPIFAETGDSARLSEQLARYIDGSASMLPLDPSGGKLTEESKHEQTLMEHIRKGGIIGYLILVLGLVTAACVIIKWIEISMQRIVSSRQIETALTLLKDKGTEAALAYTQTLPAFASEFIATGIKACNEPREILEEFVFAKILQVRPRLERFLAFISISAAASPLLGLLGTVSGIITTFGVLSVSGSSDPKSLSVGISEALVTTEFGLMVAIPALIFHAILYRMMRRKLGQLEQGMLTLLNGLAQK